jgi:flagellar hook assembly protein FlgD
VVRVYGPNGSLVRTLSQGVLPAGVTNLNWDGRDIAGREVGSGVYYVNLEVNGESVSRSMTLLK